MISEAGNHGLRFVNGVKTRTMRRSSGMAHEESRCYTLWQEAGMIPSEMKNPQVVRRAESERNGDISRLK